MRAREFKDAMRSGKVLVGFQQFMPSATLTEMAGIAGFDWVFLCTEHGSITIGSELEHITRAADAVGMASVVRVTHNDYPIILRCLELGAKGVMVPRVKSRAEVEQAVSWVKYPPVGARGICGYTRGYSYGEEPVASDRVNDESLVMLLIEELEAFDHLDEILSVPGVDCAVFGAGDLSMQLGIRQEMGTLDARALETLSTYRRQFGDACRRHNVPVGDIIRDPAGMPALLEEGVTVFASIPDTGLIQGAMTSVVRGARQAAGRAQGGVAVS
jgi:4-hydroxy-2-oxoheptanedioate aldolase